MEKNYHKSENVYRVVKNVYFVFIEVRLSILAMALADKHFFWISGLTKVETSSGASASTKEAGTYVINPTSKQYSSSMQHREDKKSLIGATSANSFAQSQLPSTEELNSRCGSRQSLLDTASHRSKSNLSVAAAHQYSNAGCTSRIVPPPGADNSRTERNSTNPSPGNCICPYIMHKII